MPSLKFVTHEAVLLKHHADFNEKWLQERISEDPSILGLGDLEVRDVERIQSRAGRLDMLLRDPDTSKRYEVEIMLGEVDESHIIRTIEYWDIERKRYPQYDHTAVIVAEKINARFLNVINLFNSAIPIIAVQLNALRVGDQLVLNFTKVLDEIVLGQEDEETEGQVMDRAYWEARGSKTSMKIVDECLSIVKETQPSFDLKYNKYYIGLASSGVARNFILFRAKRLMTRIEAKIADQPSWSSRLEDAGLSVLPGIIQRERLVFQVRKDDVAKNRDLLKELFEASYQEYTD